jgi:hypothetical protein
MNFTSVLDELLICQIASTHHENTEFDHCFSPVTMGDCVIDLTKSLDGGSGGCILPASPRRASGRVVAGPGVSGRQAATSKSSTAWTNAARSIGERAVTILPSVIAGSSMKVAPAFSRSGFGPELIGQLRPGRRPVTHPARVTGPHIPPDRVMRAPRQLSGVTQRPGQVERFQHFHDFPGRLQVVPLRVDGASAPPSHPKRGPGRGTRPGRRRRVGQIP